MKTIKYLNTFAIGLPITLILIGFLINDATGNWIGYGLFSTMLTGFIQVILGLFLLFKNPENNYLRIYIVSVILFFLLWFIDVKIFYSDILSYILFPIPLILATYLTILIYKKMYL